MPLEVWLLLYDKQPTLIGKDVYSAINNDCKENYTKHLKIAARIPVLILPLTFSNRNEGVCRDGQKTILKPVSCNVATRANSG